MNTLEKIDNALAIAERVLIVIAFSLLILLVSANIVLRNLFGISFQAVLEAAPALVMWLALLGATLAMKNDGHIKLELFLRYCPDRVRRGARRASSLFGLIVSGALGIASFSFVYNEIDMFGSWGYVAIIFPVFFAILTFRFLKRMIDRNLPITGVHLDEA